MKQSRLSAHIFLVVYGPWRPCFFSLYFLKIILFTCLFIFGCAGSLWRHRLFSPCCMKASHCSDFSCCRFQALGWTGSSSYVTWAQQLWLPGSRAQAQQLWCTGLAAPRHVGSSWIRDQTGVSCIGRQILYLWTTRESLELFWFLFFHPWWWWISAPLQLQMQWLLFIYQFSLGYS